MNHCHPDEYRDPIKNMNDIDKQINKIKFEKSLGLMTHVIVGYPSLEDTIQLVKLMDKSGVDFVELQIPFSDPLADGPTIMRASEEALKNGVKVKDAFVVAKKLNKEINIPLLFMAYYNTVFNYGTKKFCSDAKKAGISGLIVPDMPIEEEPNEHFMKYCQDFGLHHIRVISPASTDERLQKNAKVANGFIYFTARQGITGAKNTLDPKLINNLKKINQVFQTPIAVGFGISKTEHLQAIKPYADIAVIGSALLDIINMNKNSYLQKVADFLQELTS